jgi:hypothetical protein
VAYKKPNGINNTISGGIERDPETGLVEERKHDE